MRKKSRIVLLVPHMPEPIIYKRVDAEKEHFEVHLVYWDWMVGNLVPKEPIGFTEHRISISAKRDPLRRLLQYLCFFIKARHLLAQLKPDIIHCCGLDALFPAVLQNLNNKKKAGIIYEVADLHGLQISHQKNPARKLLQKAIRTADQFCCKHVELLLTTSEKYYEAYYQRFLPPGKHFDFPNIPDLSVLDAYQPKDHTKDFTVGYIGGVRYKKPMRNLVEAAKMSGVSLMIAGFEAEPIEIEPLCKAYSRGSWMGRFDYDTQIASLYGKCDVIYSVYDPSDQNTQLALPNKLYEAICCELPILAASGTYLGELVSEWKVGIAVSPDDPEETAAALSRLRSDRDYYRSLQQGCAAKKAEFDLKGYNEMFIRRINQLLEQNFS